MPTPVPDPKPEGGEEGEDATPPAVTPKPDDATPPKPETPPAPAAKADEPKPGTMKHLSKLYETEKTRASQLEAKVQELTKQIVPGQERETITKQLETVTQRNKALEDAIEFLDYQQSKPYQEQYVQPYQAAWTRACTDIAEIPVIDPSNGQQRAMDGNDLSTLMSLRLPEARAFAEALVGENGKAFVNDIMDARKDVKVLFDKMSTALTEGRKNGEARRTQRQQQMRALAQAAEGDFKEAWEGADKEVFSANPELQPFFTPRVAPEGQQPTPEEAAWNDDLAKGIKFTEEAYKAYGVLQNPAAPKADRQEAAKKLRAVFNRSAGWKALKNRYEASLKTIAKLEKALADYQGSTPAPGGRGATPPPSGPVRAMDRLNEALTKIAH